MTADPDTPEGRLRAYADGLVFRSDADSRDVCDDIRAVLDRLARAEEEQAAAVADERARMMEWCAKRAAISRAMWERASRKALDGDMAELRNRIALIDAAPMEIVQSAAMRGKEQP